MLQIGSRLHKRELSKRYLTLSFCTSPLIGAYFFGYTEASSPFKCLFLASTGIPCPGCGLTRSFLATAHNNLQEALNYHLFGPVLFVALIIGCIHLIFELTSRRSITTFYGNLLFKRNIQFSFVGMLLSYHFLRLYTLWESGELAISFQQSPLGQLL